MYSALALDKVEIAWGGALGGEFDGFVERGGDGWDAEVVWRWAGVEMGWEGGDARRRGLCGWVMRRVPICCEEMVAVLGMKREASM